MTKLKRPERYVQFESIKPELKEITEFYTRKTADYQYKIKQLNEYADALENEISVLKETPKVEVLLDDTAKPLVEVPQIVADWIKALKAKGINLLMNSGKFGEAGFTEEELQEIIYWINEHQEEYMRAWLDCYMVKKEQLYYIKLPRTGAYYLNLRIDTGDFVYGDNEDYPNYKTKFTEQEIKDIDERYWSFRVEVDE